MQEDMKEELATKIATKINLQKKFFFLGIISWKGASFFNGGCFSVEGASFLSEMGGGGRLPHVGHQLWETMISGV